MVAGVLTVSSAIGSSGLGDVIGQAIEDFLGGSNNSFLIILVFTTAAHRDNHLHVQHRHPGSADPHRSKLLPGQRRRSPRHVLAVNIAAVFALPSPPALVSAP